MRLTLLAFLLLAPLSTPAFAQVGGDWKTHFQFDGAADFDKLGISVSDAGDVNGDGFDDVIVGAHHADPSGRTRAGSALVFSGADGSILYQFDGTIDLGELGFSVSGAGDVNGDGFDDVIVGAPVGAGSAFVYSGADGSTLYQFDGAASGDTLGTSVSDAGDVNGDGFDDVIVGAIYAAPGGLSSAGSAFVYSGADGSILYQFDGAAVNDNLGFSVSGAGDVNGDGFDDLIVGANRTDPGGLFAAGSAFVYSGADGSTLHQFDGAAAGDTLGDSVSGAGDVNGDGFDDVIVGAAFADPGGFADAGSAFVYSGADGSILYQFDGAAADDHLGISVSGTGDVDGDGFDDLIVGAYFTDPGGFADAGSAFVYSGADGSTIHQYNGAAAGDQLGISVSGAGDVNGDGFADLIVGAHHAAPGGLTAAGSAFVFGVDPYLTPTSSTISAGTNTITGLQLDFPEEAALSQYRVLLSVAGTEPFTYGVEIPLTLDSYALNSYFGIYPFPLTSNMQGTLNVNGDAHATFGAPKNYFSSVVGATVYFAAIAGPAGYAPDISSVAVSITIVP